MIIAAHEPESAITVGGSAGELAASLGSKARTSCRPIAAASRW